MPSDLIRTLQTTFQLCQKFFLGLEDCMLSFWSPGVLFICGRVGTVERRSQERHQFNRRTTDSKIVAETDVVAESVEDMFPIFKCVVLCNGPWRDGNHETHTQWQGVAFNKNIYETKRAKGE